MVGVGKNDLINPQPQKVNAILLSFPLNNVSLNTNQTLNTNYFDSSRFVHKQLNLIHATY